MNGLLNSILAFFTLPNFGDIDGIYQYIAYFSRFLIPIIGILVLNRCIRSMFSEYYEPEIWGYIDTPDGSRIPLRNWECTIGRSRVSDVPINNPSIAKTQLVLVRDELGNWMIYNIENREIYVNDELVPLDGMRLYDGDYLNVCGSELRFFNLTEEERAIIDSRRTAPGRIIPPRAMFTYVTIFQLVLLFQHLIWSDGKYISQITLGFVALIVIMWLYFLIMRSFGRQAFEVEAIAFFLCTIGLSVVASSAPENMFKQIILLTAGIITFIILGWWLRDLKRVKALRWVAAIFSVALLAVNIVAGTTLFGAKNWISIGSFMFQPSEFVKIAYIYAGAATMDRLYRGRNILLYIVFSAICVGALALMGDFGTALVFFATFLVISFMRSGNIGTVILAVSGAAFAGFLAFSMKPHIAARFATWGHVWEDINGKGFQQTRAMSAVASGGMCGRGAGNGWLHNIVAADTDLAFEVVCEELGVIIGIIAVLMIIVLAVYVVHNGSQGRSSFYLIAGTAAASMMMIQLSLNVFGSLDILPFTGVTFPFVSTGGSSLISCWAILAFIKATDTRKNASMFVRNPSKMRDYNEFNEYQNYDENIQQVESSQDILNNSNQPSIDYQNGLNEEQNYKHKKRKKRGWQDR